MMITDEIKDAIRERCKRENYDTCVRYATQMLQHDPILDVVPDGIKAAMIDHIIDRAIEIARAKRISNLAAKVPEQLMQDPDYLYGCRMLRALACNNADGFWRHDRWVTSDRWEFHREAVEKIKAAYIRLGIDDGYYYMQDGKNIMRIGYQVDVERIFEEACHDRQETDRAL